MLAQGFNKQWAVIGQSRDDVISDITSHDSMSMPSNTRQFNAF
jgi:hypothetical protein